MSSKTKNQKPSAQKPETEVGEDAQVNTEVTTAGDEPAADAPQVEAPQVEAPQPDAPQPDAQAQPNAKSDIDEPEPVAVIETVAAAPAAAPADGLSIRLTRTVNAILTSGKPEAVHALHKVELVAGTLRTALPAAIEACDAIGDEGLKADLQSLLASL